MGTPGSEASIPLIRAARLELDGHDYLCVVRDIAPGGMRVRLFHPLPAHRTLAVALGHGASIAAQLAWSDGDHAGLRFAAPADVAALIAGDAADVGPSGRREVRLRVALPAIVRAGLETVPAGIIDLSQQGACLRCARPLLAGEAVRVETALLAPLNARVQWRDGDRHGLALEHPFRIEALARTLAQLHAAWHGAALPARAPAAPAPAHRSA